MSRAQRPPLVPTSLDCNTVHDDDDIDNDNDDNAIPK